MKYLYIVVDLAKRKVVYECEDYDTCLLYEKEHQEKALYCISLAIDKDYPCSRGLWGLAL